MGVVQGAAVMLGSWLRSSRSHTSSTPSALATYITPAHTHWNESVWDAHGASKQAGAACLSKQHLPDEQRCVCSCDGCVNSMCMNSTCS